MPEACPWSAVHGTTVGERCSWFRLVPAIICLLLSCCGGGRLWVIRSERTQACQRLNGASPMRKWVKGKSVV